MCFQIIVITLVFILFGFYIIQMSHKTNSSLHPKPKKYTKWNESL